MAQSGVNAFIGHQNSMAILSLADFSSLPEISAEFDQWAAVGRGDSMAAGHHYATKKILEDLQLDQNSVVLDAGCGIGWVLNELIGADIKEGIGIDLSPEMVAIAASRCQLSHLSFLTADSAVTPFEDEKFSQIISVESIYYNAQPLAALKEWWRIAKNNARLGLVIDLHQGNPSAQYWLEALDITAHNFSAARWVELLQESGWMEVTAITVPLPLQISMTDFQPSAYFPSYEIYQAYCEAGSLLLGATKKE